MVLIVDSNSHVGDFGYLICFRHLFKSREVTFFFNTKKIFFLYVRNVLDVYVYVRVPLCYSGISLTNQNVVYARLPPEGGIADPDPTPAAGRKNWIRLRSLKEPETQNESINIERK